MRQIIAVIAVTVMTAAPGASSVAAEDWPFLDRTTIGAATFTDEHPAWDGRGVVIAVVDSGVDIGIPGLQTTSTGAVKVIEARDFTGEGDVDLHEALWRDGRALHPDGWSVAGLQRPEENLGGEVLLGLIEEERFRATGVSDVDADGRRDGRWAVACYPTTSGWRLRVDTDGDGDMADERELADYAEGLQTFALAGDPLEGGRPGTPLVFAPTILWREAVLSLHFDAGGHGTHVAGIAAGHRLGGVEGQDGVAPGAQVMSLKIGHNSLPGGATVAGSMRRAFEFGADWAERHGVPVVFNLSYGIVSGSEGRAAIEEVLDDLLVDHPSIVVVTSAGNEGPGLSTIGIPAAAEHVIAVGSTFTRDLAMNLRGQDLGRERLVYYSSRGGEVDKPDVSAPGLAYSTVARWDDHPIKSGTSMASPEVAGACALLLSAAVAEGIAPTWEDVRRSLRAGARPLSGYGPLSQGAGVVQVPRSWEVLRRLASSTRVRPLTFDVALDSPLPVGDRGRVACWRADGYVPDGRHGQRFTVTPVFAPTVPGDERIPTTVDVRLVSDAPWLEVDRSRVVFQGDQERTIAVRYDARRLRRPGVYVGRVAGIPAGQSVPAFFLTTVVVVPEPLEMDGLPRLRIDDVALEPGEVRRVFVAVPPGATAMEARIRIPEGRDGKIWTSLVDPVGLMAGHRSGRADSEGVRERVVRVPREELTPGTWELDLIGAHDAAGESRGEVEITFYGLESDPPRLTHVRGGGSEPATMALTVVNRYREPFEGTATGRIDHLYRETDEMAGPQGWEMGFELDDQRPSASFTFHMDDETYVQMTDVALRILDDDGVPVARGAVEPRGGTVSVSGAGSYTVELTPALTDDDPEIEIPFTLEQRFGVSAAATLTASVEGADDDGVALYPGVVTDLEVAVDGVVPWAPEGFVAAGQLDLVSGADGAHWLTIPVRLER